MWTFFGWHQGSTATRKNACTTRVLCFPPPPILPQTYATTSMQRREFSSRWSRVSNAVWDGSHPNGDAHNALYMLALTPISAPIYNTHLSVFSKPSEFPTKSPDPGVNPTLAQLDWTWAWA